MREPPTGNRGQKSYPILFLWPTCFLLCELFLVALLPSDLVLFVVSTFGTTLSLPCGLFSNWGTLEGINDLNFALEVNIGIFGKEAR